MRGDLVWMALLFLLTAAFRFLALTNGFQNDHFLHLASAQQMSYGEWPTRDFVDPGQPLMIVYSAVAQAVLGRTLFAEAVFVSAAFGAAAALTFAALRTMTVSTALALLAAVLEVAVFPRTYGYPKMLVYAFGLWCCARYVATPSRARLALIAVSVAVAFLFRHDHGIFLGIAAVLTVMLAPGAAGAAQAWRRPLALAALVLALTLPYLVYVEAYLGLGQYLAAGLEYSRREALRQGHIWPNPFTSDQPLQAALLYELHVIPVIALVAVLASRGAADARRFAALAVPCAVMAIPFNFSVIRDPLVGRMQDAIVPAVVLGALLVQRAWHVAPPRRLMARGAAAAAAVLLAASVVAVGQPVEEIDRAGLMGSVTLYPGRFRERTRALATPLEPMQMPSRTAASLLPFLEYVQRCTPPEARLLTAGFIPEVSYLARRPYAAGQSTFGPWWGSEEMQQLALRRLRNQVVPFFILPGEYREEFNMRFPLVADYVRSRYVTLATIDITDEDQVEIFVNSELPATGRDGQTGWPCFTAR